MGKNCSLNNLSIGDCAEVIRLENKGSIRRRLFDLGIIEGSEITCVMKAPLGDPCAYLIKGAVVAIRSVDGKQILVRCKND